ncbi:MAG TPA: TonB-dependent receptor [Burkholderiaceae bacterium]|nr:TonB-dependent receptor [Burkholderiaceae bacterium]
MMLSSQIERRFRQFDSDRRGAPLRRGWRGGGGWAIASALVLPAWGQPVSTEPANANANAPAGDTPSLKPVIVTGTKASLATAQEIKYNASGIVDAVVAEDIQRLPDISVTEALQRVTGLQITRDRGEGGSVTIRGLTQVQTTLNGREIFTAGSGRGLNFSDLPAELLSVIEVDKTPSASVIEGGIGGVIDLRTRRPFDVPGAVASGTVRWSHASLAQQSRPQYTMLLSNRWRLDSGEFGALLALTHQERAWREDQRSAGTPSLRSDLLPGQQLIVRNGTSDTISSGVRRRDGAFWALQWRPQAQLELYAEGMAAQFRTLQNSTQLNTGTSANAVPGSLSLFPGTNDVRSISWASVPVSILSFARDTVDRTSQAAIGGSWTQGRLTLKADLSRTKSVNDLFFSGPFFGATASNVTHDFSNGEPVASIGGTDLRNASNLTATGVAYRVLPFQGDLQAARLDADYQLGTGFWRKLAMGLRLSQRRADNASGLIFGDTSVNLPATSLPSQMTISPNGSFLVGSLDAARDPAALRALYGITAGLPTAGNPLSTWRIGETTTAAYASLAFVAPSAPWDGKLGLRMVRTRAEVRGFQSLPAGGVDAIVANKPQLDWLPSLHLRYEPEEGLQFRLAASRSLTRPNFDQLSPSLTLVRNPVNPELNRGGAGNPHLQPMRASNLDLSAERYFSPHHSVYLTGFLKKVDGFVGTISLPEQHGGEVYQVSRPYNTADATIKGLELGYKRFFTHLPGWLGGLGLLANFTYVDSRTPSSLLGQDVPLQNLSPRSANVMGVYERGAHSLRLAYNWRSRYLSGIAGFVGVGALPVYTEAYGWLDASWVWRINRHTSIAIEGSNLLRSERRSYYGLASRVESVWRNDRQLAISATWKM